MSPSRSSASLALALLGLLAARGPAQVTHRVPQDFPTIQQAVDAAGEQDTVLVGAGTYAENVVITGAHLLFLTGKGKVVIAPATGDAVHVEDSDFVFVTNIRTLGGGTGFRLVDCTSCQLVKCRVEGCSDDGVRLQGGATNTLQKLTVVNAGFDAIALSAGIGAETDDTQIVACRLVDPGRNGVTINGSGNLVIDCRIVRAAGSGIMVEGFTPDANGLFERCRILKSQFHGLVFTGDGMVVDRCTVTRPGGHGILFQAGTGGGVAKSKVILGGQDGVSVSGDGFSLEELKVRKPAGDGVIVQGDAVLVQGCKVSAAGANGYDVQGTAGAYVGNVSGKAGFSGFLLEGTGNTLSLNKATGSGSFDLENPVPANNTVADDNSFKTQGP